MTFDEASTVFADPLSSVFADPDHSLAEARLVIVGRSDRDRVLAAMFTERPPRVRLISARPAPAPSGQPMKPATSDQPGAGAPARDPDELLPEYDPALIRAGERGRYAARYARGTNLVPLDPDVAAAFPDPAAVNAVLRAAAALIRAHESARRPGRAGPDAAAA